MSRINAVGLMFAFVHFAVEVSCFYIISSYAHDERIWLLGLLFDFVAFVPQGLFGYIYDKIKKINFGIIGTVLTCTAVLMYHYEINPFLVIFTLTLGNAMIHLFAAELTLRGSKGKMTPSAVFVAGGSFGVITGKLLSMYGISEVFILLIDAVSLIPIIIAGSFDTLYDDGNLKKYNYSNKKTRHITVIILSVIVVTIRSYMGYGIPTAWNKTVLQNAALFCCMGLGKAAGGILIDTIGIRKTAFISTLCSMPLLMFGNSRMYVSLLGVMMFSMTMAVTLALLVSELQNSPGVAFGLTTIGLFLGFFIVFFYRISSLIINCIVVGICSVLSMLILNHICRKEDKV